MEKEYVIINESVIRSITKDAFLFGTLFLFYWLNYNYLGNNTIVTITISICFFLAALGFAKKYDKSMTAKHAIEKINKEL